MKFLVVGLGNPGFEYENNRHNVGFKIIDAFCSKHKGVFKDDKTAQKCQISFRGKKIILIKPNTFMNLSGKAVNYWLQKEGVPIERLIVLTDDLSLPFGKLRMKGSGSDGGHNGLKDIQEKIGTPAYVRLRFGIGNDYHKGHQVGYVLGNWNDDEITLLKERLETAVNFIESYCLNGLQLTMTEWNGK